MKTGTYDTDNDGRYALPQIKVRNILIDIDNTLTDSIDMGFDPFIGPLKEIIVGRDKITHDQAETQIRRFIRSDDTTMSEILPSLHVDELELWHAVVKAMRGKVKMFPDAIEMCKRLTIKDFDIYPATTNSAFAILAKLGASGMASEMKTELFKSVCGGSELCPGGKSGALFYLSIIKRFSLEPDETAMIGDNPVADSEYPRQAGIKKIFIIDRTQKEKWIRKDNGVIYVNTLDIMSRILIPVKNNIARLKQNIQKNEGDLLCPAKNMI